VKTREHRWLCNKRKNIQRKIQVTSEKVGRKELYVVDVKMAWQRKISNVKTL
jgi:hypothetical protein